MRVRLPAPPRLQENYHETNHDGLPRTVVYDHYYELCMDKGWQRLSAALFGQLIRRVFPSVRIRRLGPRGSSAYYYEGIGVLPTSPLARRPDVHATSLELTRYGGSSNLLVRLLN